MVAEIWRALAACCHGIWTPVLTHHTSVVVWPVNAPESYDPVGGAPVGA